MRMKKIEIPQFKSLATLMRRCRERIETSVASVCFKLSGLMGAYFIFDFLLVYNCFCNVVNFCCTTT